jgi:biotin carboxyl carrier protein
MEFHLFKSLGMNEDKVITLNGKEITLTFFNATGDSYYTTLTKKYTKRQAWTKPNAKEVLSFIPGTVKDVMVKVGDKVTEGQTLATLEAMKMLNTIYSPFAGKIKCVNTKSGDKIPKGIIMFEFE